ncbi:MAG TPA: hypothetical protein VEK80_11555 [Kribbellaceae bacterium]|nr:hypothetical protein [Kribbellaceae bacterium]
MRARLDGLSGAVRDAGANLDEARRRVTTARQDLRALVNSSIDPENERNRAAAEIDAVREAVDGDMRRARNQLGGSREALEDAGPAAGAAAYESEELAATMRAALNPTPASELRTPAAPSEADLRHRLNGLSTDKNHDRSPSD